MNTIDLTELRDLDVAPRRPLTAQESQRSRELLLSLMAEDQPIAERRTRSRLKVALVAVTAGALIVGGAVTAVPTLRGLGGSLQPAASGPLTTVQLAAWTSKPTTVASMGTLGTAEKNWCLSSSQGGPGSSDPYTITNADQRGLVASMIINRGGYALLCITGGTNGFWEVAAAPTDPTVTVASDAVTIGSAGSQGDGSSAITYAEGMVGSAVASITISDSGKTFAATVENGRWTAWWPTADPHGTITGTVTITTKDGATHSVPGGTLQG